MDNVVVWGASSGAGFLIVTIAAAMIMRRKFGRVDVSAEQVNWTYEKKELE